jgi:hypothetical protein
LLMGYQKPKKSFLWSAIVAEILQIRFFQYWRYTYSNYNSDWVCDQNYMTMGLFHWFLILFLLGTASSQICSPWHHNDEIFLMEKGLHWGSCGTINVILMENIHSNHRFCGPFWILNTSITWIFFIGGWNYSRRMSPKRKL